METIEEDSDDLRESIRQSKKLQKKLEKKLAKQEEGFGSKSVVQSQKPPTTAKITTSKSVVDPPLQRRTSNVEAMQVGISARMAAMNKKKGTKGRKKRDSDDSESSSDDSDSDP